MEWARAGVSKMTKTEITFNDWSRERIRQGRKWMTSRHTRCLGDIRIKLILPITKWGFIRNDWYGIEGADSPEELQRVIENIYKRKVPDDEMFYVHFGDFR